MSPPPSYYEPPDHIDTDDDTPDWPAEALTISAGGGWWTAAGEEEEQG